MHIFIEQAIAFLLTKTLKRTLTCMKFSEQTLRQYFTPIVSAVNLLHKRQLAHGDLQLSNILI